jgi:hypothetical protein
MNPQQAPTQQMNNHDAYHFDAVDAVAAETQWRDDAFLFNATQEVEPEEAPVALSPSPVSVVNAETPSQDLSPTTLVAAKAIGGATRYRPMVALLDSGGSHIMINCNALPRGCSEIIDESRSFNTTAGQLQTCATIVLTKVFLPELSRSRYIPSATAYVFDDPGHHVPYDIILGRNFLNDTGLILDFHEHVVKWADMTLPMRPSSFWQQPNQIQQVLSIEPPDIAALEQESHAVSPIADAKYEQVNLEELVSKQSHLSVSERNDLYRVLIQHELLFSGKLGTYQHKVFHLDLKPGAVPYHSKPYAVAMAHEATFKKELQRLVDIGVLKPCGATRWAAGTFIIPKKDGTVRWISDFRKLNFYIDRKKYPLPQIQQILLHQRPYRYFTKIDVSMQYYTFRLDEESQELCTIVTPYGKYQYTGLPMGVCQSSDFAQATMEEVLAGIPNVV